jgi:two-component system sensor histidine kinase PhoQ
VGAFGVSWATGPVPINYTFAVAEDLAELNREVAGFRVSLWRWLGAMSLLMLLALALILGWGLRPLRRVAAEVAAVESGRQRRIEGIYPAELGLLTDNLNTLLAQERARQQRLDHALGDLAHSLKTPMAVMAGVIDETASDVPGRRILHEQLGRMREIVEYQLRRARAGAIQTHGLAPRVSVRRTAERLAASLAKVYREKSVTLDFALEGDPAFKGSESDLMELLGNLLDNAYKWCRGRVRLTAGQAQGHLQISVEDDGPGIGYEEAERLMERGVRADETAPGHGLGLAVARQIVLAYGGRIEIGRSSLGGAALRVAIGVLAGGGRASA